MVSKKNPDVTIRVFFCRVINAMQDPAFVQQAFSDIAPRYVLTNHVLSLGIDVLWRRRVARLAADDKPQRILDLATGSGDLAVAVLETCPGAHLTAADFCEPMLEHARKRGLTDTLVADGMAMPFEDQTFDLVTIGFGLRNMADYPKAVQEMRRVLKPGGRLLVLDFSLPENILRLPYRFYLHYILPMVAGWLTGQRQAYEYLGGSIEKFPSGAAMCDLIAARGFRDVTQEPLSFGVASIYSAFRA